MSKETNDFRKENASVLMIGNRIHIRYIFFFDSEFFPILNGNSLITICIMHLATRNDSTALFVSYLRFSVAWFWGWFRCRFTLCVQAVSVRPRLLSGYFWGKSCPIF